MVGLLHAAEHALRVRHQHGEAAVWRGDGGDAFRRAVRVVRVRFGGGALVVDEAHGFADLGDVARLREVGVAFAMGDGDAGLGAGHAVEEDRRGVHHFDHGKAAFEFLRLVARELGPGVGAGDDGFQVAHHLAAVADAEAEAVRAVEEARELFRQAGVEQNRFRPAFARAQHVAVREAAHGDDALEVVQFHAARNQVAHVHVDSGKTCLVHHVGRLDVRVDALLAQDGDARTHAGGDEWRGDVLVLVERDDRRHARILHVQQAVVFGVRASRIVAQAGDAPARFAPQAVQFGARLGVNQLGVAREFDDVAVVQFADDMAAGAQVKRAQHVHDERLFFRAHLDDGAQLFAEQGAQGQFVAAFRYLAGPVLGVAPVARMLAFHGQHVQVDGHARVAGEGHFRQGGVQAAVRTVMVGQQLVVAIELLNGGEEAFQVFRAVHVRRFIAQLLQHLRQGGSAEAVLAATQVDQDQ